jgi:fluoride exporter
VSLLLIALAGALGAVSRVLVDAAISAGLGSAFPFGILIVNVTGAFAVGLLAALIVERGLLPADLRGPLLAGFLGAYTTFSTLMLDSLRLAEGGASGQAALNLVGSFVLGLLAVAAGLALGRAVG